MRIYRLAVLSFVIIVGGFVPFASADPGSPNGEAKGWKTHIKEFLAGKKEDKGKSAPAGIQNSPVINTLP